jgi:hypothetical protein
VCASDDRPHRPAVRHGDEAVAAAVRPSDPETNIVMLDLVREADSSEAVMERAARLIAEVLR